MHSYSAALLVTGAAAGAAYAQLLAGGRTVHLRSVSLLVNGALVETSVGLVRAATNGTASAALYHRRTVIKSGSSGEFAWSWEHGEMVLAPGESLLLWNFGADAGADLEVTLGWDEA